MGWLIAGAALISFFVTLFTMPFWIRGVKSIGLVGKDMHKLNKRPVAELGGLVVMLGILFGLFLYIAVKVFVYQGNGDIGLIFAVMSSLLIAMVIGLVDDILGWKMGLSQGRKVFLTFLIALPMMVINAGVDTMTFPFFGDVTLGYIYPLFFIPLAIMGTSNAFNMLGGFNGLEAGMGVIILSALGVLSVRGSITAGVVAACLVASLLAFLYFNRYPARIFPGDTLTYTVGAAIGILAIIGNKERFALILFSLYFIEVLLKFRGKNFWKRQMECFGKVQRDGSLINRYKKWYSLTHVAISFLRRVRGEGV